MEIYNFLSKRLTTIFYLALFLAQQAANGKLKINSAYKNWEFYTKSFGLDETE